MDTSVYKVSDVIMPPLIGMRPGGMAKISAKRFYPSFVPAFHDEPSFLDFEVCYISEQVGEGVVARRSFRSGDLVFRFSGQVISTITQFSLKLSPGRHLHDPWFMGKVLHNCDPNCSVDMSTCSFHARRDIKQDELITMDYMQTEDELFKPFVCGCGASNCRSLIY